jgi:hypothetical protein
MKTFTTTIAKNKWLIISLSFSALIIFMFSLIGLNQASGINSTILSLSHWIKTHKYLFLLWHMFIVFAIYIAWGVKVERQAKRYNLSEKEVKKAKRFRYALIGFVVLVDILTHWY